MFTFLQKKCKALKDRQKKNNGKKKRFFLSEKVYLLYVVGNCICIVIP